jgi:hypothetical protein
MPIFNQLHFGGRQRHLFGDSARITFPKPPARVRTQDACMRDNVDESIKQCNGRHHVAEPRFAEPPLHFFFVAKCWWFC